MSDPHHLERFIAAQAPVYAQVVAELRAGRKRTHWMWFIFPQIRGLGSSPTAQHYAIASLDEARAYLAHPVLGPRLIECTTLVLQHAAIREPVGHEPVGHERTSREHAAPTGQHILDKIFGYPDNLKFHSSMTLFSRAADTRTDNTNAAPPSIFQQALKTFFAGQHDEATIALLL